LIIPYEKLSPEALQHLIEDFVTRPGTDTGYANTDLEHNVEMVKRQLKQKLAFVVFDEKTQTADIVTKDALNGKRSLP